MRQESLYRKDAVSRADARGLMQMLPATAAAVARRWHLPAAPQGQPVRCRRSQYRSAPRICANCSIDSAAGSASALAAYNAGPTAVARWLPEAAWMPTFGSKTSPTPRLAAMYSTSCEHIVAFAYVSDAEPPRLEVLLPAVEPASGGEAAQGTRR